MSIDTVGQSLSLDSLDRIAANAFDGYIVRKDLVRRFKGQYPVPTYVGEFLLGRYCASTDDAEITEGLQIVEKQMRERTVRAGEEELFKHRARQHGSARIIDLVTAKLDAETDSYLASLASLQMTKLPIPEELVHQNERMLTGGFYAEVELSYLAELMDEGGRSGAFAIRGLRPIQLSKRNVLEDLARGRAAFTTEEWKRFLLRSVGLEPDGFDQRAQDTLLLRMVPFVERNYNAVELGPRGTGKSHLYQQISPYSHLVSGGKATVARMFVNNASGQRGLVCQYDVVCFDEVSGVSFDQRDGVNIMKGYMESGEFSRGRESIRAEGGVVMVGNFDVDVEQQQRVGHLFGPMPPEMRNDTALMDRIHAYIPGWAVPKMDGARFTDHFGLVSDFLSECWTRLRTETRLGAVLGHVDYGGALSGRDTTAVNRTVNGLLKLISPDPDAPIPDADLEWAVRLGLECRRRVKEQQKRIGSAEFRNTQFSYRMGVDGVETFVSTPELQSDVGIGGDPLPPGHAWGISPGGQDEAPGLYRLEVNAAPGSGMKLANIGAPGTLRESAQTAYQNLVARNAELLGDRDSRQYELHIQARAMDVSKSGAHLGLPVLLAFCSAILGKSLKGGLVAAGGLSVGGSFEPIHNATAIAELAVEKGAQTVLFPVSARRQLNDLSDEMAAKLAVVYCVDVRDAFLKALGE